MHATQKKRQQYTSAHLYLVVKYSKDKFMTVFSELKKQGAPGFVSRATNAVSFWYRWPCLVERGAPVLLCRTQQ